MALSIPFISRAQIAAVGNEPPSPSITPAWQWQALILRFGFLSTGSLMLFWASHVWERGQVGTHHEVVAMTLSLYVLAFLLLGMAVLNVSRLARYVAIIPVAALIGLAFNFYVTIEISIPSYGTDTLALSHVAAATLLAGDNPFSVQGQDTVIAASERFGLPATFVTPTTDGESIDRLLSWPAGHFLPFVPALKPGITDLRWVVGFVEVLTFLLLWWKAPSALRPLTFIPILIDPNLGLNYPAGGVTDFIWVLPLVGTALSLKERRYVLAALLFGVAAATKQQPWILAPFLAIWVWHDFEALPIPARLAAVAKFAVVSAIGFLAVNLPFIVWDPGSWLASVLLPARDQLIPFGSGISMLTQVGIAQLPKHFYTLASFGVWAILVLAYAIHFRVLRLAIWLFPAIVLWFGYRSLQNYFIFWTPLLLVALFFWWEEANKEKEPSAT